MEYTNYAVFYLQFDPEQRHGYKFNGMWRSRLGSEFKLLCGGESFTSKTISLLQVDDNIEARTDNEFITFEKGDKFMVYQEEHLLFVIEV